MVSKKIINAIDTVTSFLENRYPVDLNRICSELEIKVKSHPKLDKDGYLICQQGKKIILTNERIYNQHRQDFIIAHEIGHFMLHQEKLYSCKDLYDFGSQNINSQIQEQEANVFANELLMPSNELGKYIPAGDLTLHDIFRIATIFDVSVTHAALRAVKMSNTESEVLVCYENQRVKWFVSADPNIYLRMIPATLPEYVPDVNGETDVYGGWLDLYEGSVHQEVFHTYGTQKLLLLSGKRK